jgi:hypothetical protein
MAALSLGRLVIGIEREPEYVEIAKARTAWTTRDDEWTGRASGSISCRNRNYVSMGYAIFTGAW